MAGVPLGLLLRSLRRLVVGPAGAADDARLLEAFALRRDEAAFAALVERHGPMVLATCRRVLGNDHDAEDAFQATFLVLARKAGSIRRHEAPGAWLYGVAFRTALKARAALARQRAHERRAAEAAPAPGAAGAAQDDLRPVLEEELARLPEKYRLPLVLCDLGGKTHEAAAAVLGCPAGSMSWRLARGRELLRERLVRRGVTVGAAALTAALAEGAAAAVSAAAVRSTVEAALAFAACTAPATSAAAVLAEGVLKAMCTTKARGPAVAALLALVLAAGGGLLAYQGETPGPAAAPARATPVAEKPRADLFGDPLPAGALARLGTVRWRGGNRTVGPVASPDGKLLATGDKEGTTLWDAGTGKPLRRLRARDGEVSYLAFSPDGKMLAWGESEVWLPRAKAAFWVMDLVAGKEPRRVGGEDTDRRNELGMLPVPTAVAFSPDGKLLAGGNLTGGVRVWDLSTGKVYGERLALGTRTIQCVAFSPDGKRLAVAGEHLGPVLLEVGPELKVLRRLRHEDGFHALELAFLPDGKALCYGAYAQKVVLWDAETGAVRRRFPDDEDFREDTTAVALSRDGKRLALCTEGDLRVVEVETGKELVKRKMPWHNGFHNLLFTPDGRTLFMVGEGDVLHTWDAKTLAPTGPPEGHTKPVSCGGVSGDGALVATHSGDHSVAVWDSATGRRLHFFTLRAYADNALSPDGKLLGTNDGSDGLRLWDTVTGRERPCAETGPGYAVAFSPDNRLVISGGLGEALLLDVAAGRVRHRLGGHQNCVQCLAFSADGKTLATADGTTVSTASKGPENVVQVWDVASGKLLRRFDAGRLGVKYLRVSDGGARVWVEQFEQIDVWDVPTGTRLRRYPAREDSWSPIECRSPDGRSFVRSAAGNVALLVESASGKVRRTFRGHQRHLLRGQFFPDGRRLVTGSADTTALVWDVTGRAPAGRLKPADLSAEELAARWEALLGGDAGKAFDALWDLVAAPQSVPFLRERLRPVPPPDPVRLAKLLGDLDADEFDRREAATKELAKLGELAETALAKALAGSPSAEVRRRAKELLAKVREPSKATVEGESLRQLRAVEALEQIGTPAARELLEALAKGAPEAQLTWEAGESLGRLKRSRRD